MAKKGLFTKILATLGTVIVWLPILAPLLTSGIRSIASGFTNFDYLMPAELFPLVIVGGGLLLWAALRARSRGKLIGWCLAAAVGALVFSQGLAVVTGLATGAVEPAGLPLAAVMGFLIVYDLSVLGVGIGGFLLLRDLYKPSHQSE